MNQRSNTVLLPALLLPALLVALGSLLPPALAAQSVDYPETHRSDVVDEYHGTRVADPYRWLEDTGSEAAAAWIRAQNEVTSAHLESLSGREGIRDRLTELWDYERFGVPFREGGRYFYFHNDGLQDQAVLYALDSLGAEPRLVLDPNTFSEDGTVSLAGLDVADDGRHLAYAISEGGSDWREIRVLDLRTGEDLDDRIRWVKFSGIAFTADGEGFFYSRYPAPEEGAELTGENRNQTLHYHRIGTPQSEDLLVYERPDRPEWGLRGRVSEDGRYLLIDVSEGTEPKNRLHYVDLGDPASPDVDGEVVRLLDDFDASYRVIGNDGPILFVRSDLDAPMGRILAVDLRRPDRAYWRTVVPERDEKLESASLVGGRLVTRYLEDARTRMRVYDFGGDFEREISLGQMGSVTSISGREDDGEMFYAFTSFLHPQTVLRYDLDSGEHEVFRAPDVDFDPSRYTTRQVFYESADGTRVPMFVTHRRGLELDGSNPTYLYGYGGFNVSLTPSFSVSNLVWIEMGGVYAVPNLRGGGEYGEEWHRSGTLENKQNVFDDFIAAAEHLIEEGYTSPERLAIGGGSNGGLLVGAAMTQRPDLFAVAHPAVGVLDMLRYHRFTIGWAWASDYGTADDPEAFEFLRAYSPLHNVEEGTCYPATLVTTADHDDRVVPGHSFKFAAALQHAQGCPEPVLIRIETRAGHGAGTPTSKRIEEATDVLSFRLHHLEGR